MQFWRYNWTPMKVASTKYEVATSIIIIFMLKMCTCIKLFLRPPFSVSFTEILKSYGSSIRSWTPETGTPTDPTGSPELRKNHLDEVQAGSGAITHQEDICVI